MPARRDPAAPAARPPGRALRELRDYVAIPSVNPMGRDDLPAAIAGETRLAQELRERLARLGLDAVLIGEGERCSVVAEARAPRGAARDTLLVASHLDTVPVDGMEIEPFEPRIAHGRLYGRGSCDTKAGMAALVAALGRVLERGTLRRNLLLVGEADEELASLGIADLLRHFERQGTLRPDWALVTEPTSLRVVHRHKGVALARLEARGRACHASDPAAGRNAVVAIARAAIAIDALGRQLGARPVQDRELGGPTLSIGCAGGGQAPNIVPDAAWLVLDRRLLPGESAGSVRREIEEALAREGIEDVAVAWCRAEKTPLGTPADHPAVRHCEAALAAAGLGAQRGAVAFGTDAGLLADAGIPGVVMGPGSIERAHTAREYVEVEQVEAMTEVFVALLEGAAPPGAAG